MRAPTIDVYKTPAMPSLHAIIPMPLVGHAANSGSFKRGSEAPHVKRALPMPLDAAFCFTRVPGCRPAIFTSVPRVSSPRAPPRDIDAAARQFLCAACRAIMRTIFAPL